MTRIHDMGGRFGDGPVMPDDAVQPCFQRNGTAVPWLDAGSRGPWALEYRRLAPCARMSATCRLRQVRLLREMAGRTANLLVAKGIVSIDEIAAGKALTDADAALRDRVLQPQQWCRRCKWRALCTPDSHPAVCRRRCGHDPHHCRNRILLAGTQDCPLCCRPARCHHLQHGGHVLPDSNAHFDGEAPEHLYTVSFAAGDLWQHAGHPMTPSVLIFGTAISNRHDSSDLTPGAGCDRPPRRGQAFYTPGMPKCLPLSSAFMMPDRSAGRNGLTCGTSWQPMPMPATLMAVMITTAHGWPRWRPCCRAMTLRASGNRTDGGRLARAYLETPHGNPVRLARWIILPSGRIRPSCLSSWDAAFDKGGNAFLGIRASMFVTITSAANS